MSHPKAAGRELKTVRGVVKAHNFSPKGDVEGVLIEDSGRTFQVNIPPHAWPELRTAAKVGESLEVEVESEPATEKHEDGEHPAFRLSDSKPRPGHHPEPHGPKHGSPATIEGIVARLNYAKHGEANGVVLDTGDFVHMKPDGMKLVGLKAGQEVVAEGEARPMAEGHQVIEARVVNGTPLGKGPRH